MLNLQVRYVPLFVSSLRGWPSASQSVIRKQGAQFSESYLRIAFSLQKYPFFSFFLEKLFLTYIELEAKEKVLQIMLCFHFRSICLLMLKRQRNTASRSWYKPFL